MTEVSVVFPATTVPASVAQWEALALRMSDIAHDPVHDVFHNILLVISYVELVLQCYNVFMMLKVSVDTLKEYRFYMLNCAIWDIAFVLSFGLLLKPRLTLPLYICVLVKGLPEHFGHPGAIVTFAMCLFAGISLIQAQYYALVYRLTVVLEKRQINQEFVRRRWKAGGVIVGTAIASILTYWVTSGLVPASETIHWAPGMLAHQATRPEDTSAFCFDFVRPRMMYAFLGVGALFLVLEVVSVFTGYLVIRRLRRTAKFSVRTSQMHLQLTRLLIAQILSPVLCMFLPVAAACVAILANGGIIVYALDGYIALLMLSLFPLINAVLTIAFVAPYRNFTVKWLTFGRVILHKMESTVADSGSGIHIVSDVVAAYQRRQTMVFVYVQRNFRPLGS